MMIFLHEPEIFLSFIIWWCKCNVAHLVDQVCFYTTELLHLRVRKYRSDILFKTWIQLWGNHSQGKIWMLTKMYIVNVFVKHISNFKIAIIYDADVVIVMCCYACIKWIEGIIPGEMGDFGLERSKMSYGQFNIRIQM